MLVVVTDDQRSDTLKYMSFTRRMFARSGVRYSNAFTTTPTCCPARASILTGLYAHNHGVQWTEDVLEDHSGTIQSYLQQAGYQTGIAGKFLNSWDVEHTPPWFDHWAITSAGYSGYKANIDGWLSRRTTYHTNFVSNQSVRMLRAFDAGADKRPWFLYVAPYAPHAPAPAEKKYADEHFSDWDGNPAVHEEDRSDKPEWVQEHDFGLDAARDLRLRQLRSLLSADDLVERLVSVLGGLEEGRRTLIIFMSDNGVHWGEHRLKKKGTPYDEAARIPLLARWPGHLSRGGLVERLVANIDIAPTVLEAARVTPSSTMDGRTLLPSNDEPRERLLLEHWRVKPDWASFRSKNYQYTEYYDESSQAVTFREFYDLSSDRWQLLNLYGDTDPGNDPSPAETAQLSHDLREARTCSGTACP